MALFGQFLAIKWVKMAGSKKSPLGSRPSSTQWTRYMYWFSRNDNFENPPPLNTLCRAGSNNVPFMSHQILLYRNEICVVLSISGPVEILMCFSTTRPSSLLCLQHFLHFQLDFFLSDPGVPGPIYGSSCLKLTK